MLGGQERESGTVIGRTGFAKKYDYPISFNNGGLNMPNSGKARRGLNQIHNRVVDESSYSLKFISDTELEREFFREFEMRGNGVEGSTG